MRVVNRVHNHTTDGRADALPAVAASLTPVDVGLLGVADLAHGCAAANIHVADFAGGQTELAVLAFLSNQLDRSTSGTCQLCAATGAELDAVNHGTNRDVAQGQVVAGLDVSCGTGLDDVALSELVRSDDVTLGTIDVVQQCDACGTVGIVLDVCNACVHAVLVVTTEVDQTVLALVAATLVTGGDAAGVVTAAGLVKRTKQGLLRGGAGDLSEISNARTAATRGRRLVLTNTHLDISSFVKVVSAGLMPADRRRCRWCLP